MKAHFKPVAVIAPKLPPTDSPRVIERDVEQQRHPGCPDRADVSTKCRILLNDAQREIDRLRRGLADAPWKTAQDLLGEAECGLPSPSACSAAPSSRKMYAVDPIGEPPPPGDQPPPPAPGPQMLTRPYVTSIGTLLDVLI